jgi:hypothetical protein
VKEEHPPGFGVFQITVRRHGETMMRRVFPQKLRQIYD